VADKTTAFVQFGKASEVETLGDQYPDCRIPTLGNAEIGFVEQGFKWPVYKTSVKAQSLVLIKDCDQISHIS
jgi:hypothetical protein